MGDDAMTKFEFLNTLKMALHGQPADKVERTVAEYERRFEQGMASGSSEAEVARALGDPWDVAARAQMPAHERAANGAAKAGRVFISGLGLAIFNLFMIIPAFLYGVMLILLYVAALACYFGGIVMVAGSFAGVDELAFRVPFEQMVMAGPDELRSGRGARMHLGISDHGIQVEREDDTADTDIVRPSASASSQASSATSAASAPVASASSSPAASLPPAPRIVIEEPDDGRALQAMRAIGLTLGGILLLLLCGVITRYTWIGLKRYVRMNISTLREA
jgi:uncharacterized membrane protein